MGKIIPGEILAQEEVKSSSSDNVYTVILYDNCISCTCPAGNKKEYCEHMQNLVYKNWQVLKKTNIGFYNKTFVLKDGLYKASKDFVEYKLFADELIYIDNEYIAEQAHIEILNEIERYKQKLNELINLIETQYSKEQQKEILKYFRKAEKESYIPDSPLLFDLIKKGILKISERKHIEYRLGKYFIAHNIEKISDKKEFIFSQLPNLKGLPRGKNTSYDDTIDFISQNYCDLFDKVLIDFKSYSFGDIVDENGQALTMYFCRTVGNGSNYKFNQETNEYELKKDGITQIMQERGFKFEKPSHNPNVVSIKIDFNKVIYKAYSNVILEQLKQIVIDKNNIFKSILQAIIVIMILPITILKLILKKGKG